MTYEQRGEEKFFNKIFRKKSKINLEISKYKLYICGVIIIHLN